MAAIHKLGKESELNVCRFLEKQGLILIEQNFRCLCGEIDLIMQHDQEIVFIEVRTRGSQDFGSAIESITKNKQKRIIKSAVFYLQKRNLFDKVYCRFDVVGVAGNQFEWIPNAFDAGYYS